MIQNEILNITIQHVITRIKPSKNEFNFLKNLVHLVQDKLNYLDFEYIVTEEIEAKNQYYLNLINEHSIYDTINQEILTQSDINQLDNKFINQSTIDLALKENFTLHRKLKECHANSFLLRKIANNRGILALLSVDNQKEWTRDEKLFLEILQNQIELVLFEYDSIAKANYRHINESESVEDFLGIINKIDMLMFVIDKKTQKIIYGNKKFKNGFPDFESGNTCHGMFKNSEKPCGSCPESQNSETFNHQSCDIYNANDNKHYRMTRHDITWVDGREAILKFGVDLTDFREAENNLSDMMKHIESQQYAMDAAAIVEYSDIEGNIIYINDNYTDHTRYQMMDIIGKSKTVLDTDYHPQEFLDMREETINNGKIWKGDVHCKDKNEKIKWFDTTIVPLLNESNEPYQFITFRYDITKHKKAQDDLLLLAKTFEQSPVSIIITDPEGVLEYVNPFYEKTSGFTAAEALGNKAEFFESETAKEMLETVRTGNVWSGTYLSTKKNGEMYWETMSISSVYDNQNDFTHFISIKEDITKKKEAEEIVKKNLAYLTATSESIDEGIIAFDSNKQITEYNSKYLEIWGLNQTQIDGLNASEILSIMSKKVDDPELLKRLIINPNYHDLDPEDREVELNDESIFRLTVKERTHEGKVYGELWMFFDITDIKIASNKLIDAKLYTENIIHSFADPFLIYSSNRKMLQCNPAALIFLGYSYNELQKMSFYEVFQSDDIKSAFDNIIENTTLESRIIIKSGKTKPVLITFSIAHKTNFNDNSFHVIVSFKDISERKTLEKQLLHAQKMESIGTMAAGIAHEINTPLQYVGNNVVFFEEGFENLINYFNEVEALYKEIELSEELQTKISEVKEDLSIDFFSEEIPMALEESKTGLSHVEKIVLSMKDFAHPSQEKAFSDLNRGVEVTIGISKNEWKYSTVIETEFDKKLPLVYCKIDEINQVLLNMIINAVHSIQEKNGEDSNVMGNIKISTSQEGKYAKISISDDGNGISEENLNRIFDQFFTTKVIGKGTGQGLALAHNIIAHKHEGKINVESKLGEGTTFNIYLPVSDI